LEFHKRLFYASTTSDVTTNHCKVDVPSGTTLFKYRLEGLASRSKKKTKKLFRTAIEIHFRDTKNTFATDYHFTIIAWKELQGNNLDFHVEHDSDHEDKVGCVWGPFEVPFGKGSTIPLFLKLKRKVELGQLRSYTKGEQATISWNS
jgi:hypothetical protein